MKEKAVRRKDQSGKGGKNYSLILYNDNVNTFEHVINALVEVCGHDALQAEQCAFIVHFKGSCEIKSGSRDILEPMSESLNIMGLDSVVKSV